MKKIIYILLLLVSFNISNSKDNFSLNPILLDFHGITGKDSTIIAYGNYGSCLISYDNDKSWKHKKIFDKGVIIKMFYEETRIVAFHRDGLVATSYDKGKNWTIIKKLDYEETYTLKDKTPVFCAYITKINDLYVYRNKDYILFIDNNFEIIKKLNIQLPSHIFLFKSEFKIRTVENDDNNYYLPIDNLKILKLGFDFKNIDTIDLMKVLKFSPDTCNYKCEIFYNKSFFYFKINLEIYKIYKDFQSFSRIPIDTSYGYKLVNYKIDFFHNSEPYISLFNLDTYLKQDTNNNVKYVVSNNSAKAVHSENSTSLKINNYQTFINGDVVYLVGIANTIRKLNLDTNLIVKKYEDISLNTNSQIRDIEIKINKNANQSDLIVFDKSGDEYDYGISYLNTNSNLFEIKMNYWDKSKEFKNEVLTRNIKNFMSFYYDIESKNNLILTQGFSLDFTKLFYSIDGENYKLKELDGNILIKYYENHKLYSYIDNTNKKYFIIEANSRSNDGYTVYFWLDENFDYIKDIAFSKDIFILNKMIDSLNYLVLSNNTIINGLQFKSTTDKGQNWEIYKEYPNTINLLESKELEINGKKIWAYTYYDFVRSQFNLDVIDVEERKVYNVFSSQLTQDQIDSIDYIGFDAAKEKFYLTFFNTLMVSSNIFEDNIKWETFNYPNNGKVNKKFQIFDKTIFARYEDDKNEDNVYWINGIEMVGDPTSVEDIEKIEEVSYIYTMPPYPNPTVSEVTAKFYWDSRIDIDNSEIAVFDITGNKVSGKENLTLEKLNEWSGNIKWNCANQPKGTYLIKIQHGNNTKTVKVVVN